MEFYHRPEDHSLLSYDTQGQTDQQEGHVNHPVNQSRLIRKLFILTIRQLYISEDSKDPKR